MWHFFKRFAWAQKSFEKLKVGICFLMWATTSVKLSEAVCLRLDISCGLRHRFEEFEKLELVWTFQCCLLQLLTNLIRGVILFERACMSSEIFLKSWSFVWAFQCRLLQLSEALWSSLKLSESLWVSLRLSEALTRSSSRTSRSSCWGLAKRRSLALFN